MTLRRLLSAAAVLAALSCDGADPAPPFAGEFELVAIGGGAPPRPSNNPPGDTLFSDTLRIQREANIFNLDFRKVDWNPVDGRVRRVGGRVYLYADNSRSALVSDCSSIGNCAMDVLTLSAVGDSLYVTYGNGSGQLALTFRRLSY